MFTMFSWQTSVSLSPVTFCTPRPNLPITPTANAEEAEVDQFYEDLQDLLELTPKKDASTS